MSDTPRELVRIVEQARLPMLSQTATRLMELVHSDDYSLQDVTRIVERDPALIANLLKVVNAPSFGLGHKVDSVARAVNFLGDKMVVGMALATCSPRVFDHELSGYAGQRGALWRHSLRTAIAARELGRKAKVAISPEQAFTAGILHDIGKAVLSEHLLGRVPEILAAVDKESVEGYRQAEREVLGFDHSQVGGAVADHWNLPGPVREAVLHHHEPRNASPQWMALVFAVHLGDIVAMMGGTGTGADTLLYPMDQSYEEFIELDEVEFDKLMLDVTLEFERTNTEFINSP
jgi:putative nucleotidyltransferase with HDIG domain